MSAVCLGLAEALGGIPALGGAKAKCVGRSDWFDIEDEADPRAEAARNICGSCSARPECASWFASLPKGNHRPAGTIAGRTYERPKLAPPQPPKPKPIRSPKPRLDAAHWLADRLADGPAPAADVVAEGVKAGLSASALDRARRIGAVSERLPGRRGASQWRLDSDFTQHSRAIAAEPPQIDRRPPAA